jgi:nicotinamidase/pyrazinamidase
MKEVVLVVDMLKGFHNLGNLANPRVAGIIPNIVQLIEKKRAEGCKIIFANDCHKPDDKEFKMFPAHCVEGTEEAELVEELENLKLPEDSVIRKTTYSAFYGTCLDYQLSQIKAERVILVGVCTNICILHTAADLRNRGYEVVVPLNCVETYDAPGHPAEETAQWAIQHMTSILGVKVY